MPATPVENPRELLTEVSLMFVEENRALLLLLAGVFRGAGKFRAVTASAAGLSLDLATYWRRISVSTIWRRSTS